MAFGPCLNPNVVLLTETTFPALSSIIFNDSSSASPFKIPFPNTTILLWSSSASFFISLYFSLSSFSAIEIIFSISLITSPLFLLNDNIPASSIQLKLFIIANPLSFDSSGIRRRNIFSFPSALLARAPSLLHVINK